MEFRFRFAFVTPRENQPAVQSVAKTILDSFLDATVEILLILFVVWLATVLFGPARWAVGMRSAVVRGVNGTLGSTRGWKAGTAWISRHRDPVRIGAGVLGIALIAFASLTITWVIVVVVLVGAVEIAASALPAAAPDW